MCSLVTLRVRCPICIFVGLGIGDLSLRFLRGEGDLYEKSNEIKKNYKWNYCSYHLINIFT